MVGKIKYYFQISTSSGVPIYRQILDQVKTHIATGAILPGAFLPSVRQVSKEIEINPMTVSKAYSLLEKEGVLEFVRGKGMRVQNPDISEEDLDQREKELEALLREVRMKAEQLSLDTNKVIQLYKKLDKE